MDLISTVVQYYNNPQWPGKQAQSNRFYFTLSMRKFWYIRIKEKKTWNILFHFLQPPMTPKYVCLYCSRHKELAFLLITLVWSNYSHLFSMYMSISKQELTQYQIFPVLGIIPAACNTEGPWEPGRMYPHAGLSLHFRPFIIPCLEATVNFQQLNVKMAV